MVFMKFQTKYRRIKDNFSIDDKLFKKVAKLEPTAVANFIPLTWHKAKDFSVWDEHGNKWIDLTSGIFVANAGHANPRIKQAIKKQIDTDLLFAYNYPTEIKYRFITKLLALSPKYFNRAILLNSGSEVMDIAYKLLKLYGQSKNKKYIVTFKGAYHGRGLSNDLISGNSNKATKWSGVKDGGIYFIDFPYQSSDKFDPAKLPPIRLPDSCWKLFKVGELGFIRPVSLMKFTLLLVRTAL
jgi:4-aminobutyrate aminotransferase-like enzyme